MQKVRSGKLEVRRLALSAAERKKTCPERSRREKSKRKKWQVGSGKLEGKRK